MTTTPHPAGGAVEAKPVRLARPDLWDVLQVVRERPGCVTYVYRNMLEMDGHRGVKTSAVLHRLKRLEQLGKVQRARTSYVVQIAWKPAADPAARALPLTSKEDRT